MRSKKRSAKIRISDDSAQALAAARHEAKPSDMIIATGSFLLAGELRQRWYPEMTILKYRTAWGKK